MTAAARPRPEDVAAIARRAGDAILKFYRRDAMTRIKADDSPVTAADDAAERLIVPALRALTPEIPVVSEEAAAEGRVPEIRGAANPGGRFWLVDPLDGTKEFIAGKDDFTVNVALIEDGRPVLGVVHVPALDLTYVGVAPDLATRQRGAAGPRRIAARLRPADGAIVLASRSHGDAAALDAFLADESVRARRTAGSALKFCLLAEGVADLYPRLGRTMEWDTAAGQAVLAAAGGSVATLDGAPLRYGKPGFENPHFVARGRGPATG